jgi:hypothetical protein
MLDKVIDLIKKNDMVKILIVVVIAFVFFKFYYKEGLENVESVPEPVVIQLAQPQESNLSLATPEINRSSEIAEAIAGTQQLTTEDLLPQYNEADEFVKQNPVAKLLQEQNFLISGYHGGINTVVQSNKIPYHDLRSAPPIPKQIVSPFMNSSYEQPMGANRRSMEIL